MEEKITIIDKRRQYIEEVNCNTDILEMLDRIFHNIEKEDPVEESSAMLKTKIDILKLRSEVQSLEFREYKEYVC